MLPVTGARVSGDPPGSALGVVFGQGVRNPLGPRGIRRMGIQMGMPMDSVSTVRTVRTVVRMLPVHQLAPHRTHVVCHQRVVHRHVRLAEEEASQEQHSQQAASRRTRGSKGCRSAEGRPGKGHR